MWLTALSQSYNETEEKCGKCTVGEGRKKSDLKIADKKGSHKAAVLFKGLES